VLTKTGQIKDLSLLSKLKLTVAIIIIFGIGGFMGSFFSYRWFYRDLKGDTDNNRVTVDLINNGFIEVIKRTDRVSDMQTYFMEWVLFNAEPEEEY
jgi:hypothetical protein